MVEFCRLIRTCGFCFSSSGLCIVHANEQGHINRKKNLLFSILGKTGSFENSYELQHGPSRSWNKTLARGQSRGQSPGQSPRPDQHPCG